MNILSEMFTIKLELSWFELNSPVSADTCPWTNAPPPDSDPLGGDLRKRKAQRFEPYESANNCLQKRKRQNIIKAQMMLLYRNESSQT